MLTGSKSSSKTKRMFFGLILLVPLCAAIALGFANGHFSERKGTAGSADIPVRNERAARTGVSFRFRRLTYMKLIVGIDLNFRHRLKLRFIERRHQRLRRAEFFQVLLRFFQPPVISERRPVTPRETMRLRRTPAYL